MKQLSPYPLKKIQVQVQAQAQVQKLRKLIIICCALVLTQATAVPKLSPGEIGGKSYILIEAESKTVLAQYHATERMAPASITKLMTAYVIYQSIANGIIALDDKTVISARARNMGGSRMFVEQGSHVSIDNLLSGLVIQSGNDAAVALAEAIAGDEERFVDVMNKQAQALGMKDSHFKNVSGMPDDDHYMSAKDIATLSLALINDFPEHYKRYREKSFTWNNITQPNRNALLRSMPNVDGLKTGHTSTAGFCLAASAKRGNMRLVSVVLGTASTGERARASKKLLAFGFDHFANQTLYKPGQQITATKLINGTEAHVGVGVSKTIFLPLPKVNPGQGLKARLVLNGTPAAPVNKGAVIGNINIQRGDTVLVSVPAVTLSAVEEIGFFKRLWRGIVNTVSGWFA